MDLYNARARTDNDNDNDEGGEGLGANNNWYIADLDSAGGFRFLSLDTNTHLLGATVISLTACLLS